MKITEAWRKVGSRLGHGLGEKAGVRGPPKGTTGKGK